MEKKLKMIFNSQKKHSTRYDLVDPEDAEKKIVGSIYWPKDKGDIPDEIKITK